MATLSGAETLPGRHVIDDLDGRLVALLDERRRAAEAIQRSRLRSSGLRVDTAREIEIYQRYSAAFGSAGSRLAASVLEICRGKLGGTRTPPEPGADSRLRLGLFSFANCELVRWGLGAEATTAAPAPMASALLTGAVDVAPISVAEYLRHTDRLLALPDLAIGSDGPIMSCQLFTRSGLEDLHGRDVALGSSSRTATLLATLLLGQWLGIDARYQVEPPVLADMLRHRAGAVLIGDAALAESLHPRPGLQVHDLGEMWREWTGLPMVFAVWAVRRTTAERRPDDVWAAHSALCDAARRGRRDLDAVARSLSAESMFTADELTRYLRVVDHSMGERQVAGLRHFAKLAAGQGGVPEDADITFLGGAG